MFRKKHLSAQEAQIPADLFATINQPQARRKRWLIEIVISLAIVLALLGVGMFVYKKAHTNRTPVSLPEQTQQSNPVTQSPQHTIDPQSSSTAEPDQTPASGTINGELVPQPN